MGVDRPRRRRPARFRTPFGGSRSSEPSGGRARSDHLEVQTGRPPGGPLRPYVRRTPPPAPLRATGYAAGSRPSGPAPAPARRPGGRGPWNDGGNPSQQAEMKFPHRRSREAEPPHRLTAEKGRPKGGPERAQDQDLDTGRRAAEGPRTRARGPGAKTAARPGHRGAKNVKRPEPREAERLRGQTTERPNASRRPPGGRPRAPSGHISQEGGDRRF